jgi:hypothetical protein
VTEVCAMVRARTSVIGGKSVVARQERFTHTRHRSFVFDVGRPDHLAPFLGFVDDELTELEGEVGNTTPPRSASRARITGLASAVLISLLSLLMISAGVFMGTTRPNQSLVS